MPCLSEDCVTGAFYLTVGGWRDALNLYYSVQLCSIINPPEKVFPGDCEEESTADSQLVNFQIDPGVPGVKDCSLPE